MTFVGGSDIVRPNIYQKLLNARLVLQDTELKKSGNNKFAGYKYFELGDFLPVQPHFPAQAPRAQRRTFPVVLHKADVVLFQIKAQGLE